MMQLDLSPKTPDFNEPIEALLHCHNHIEAMMHRAEALAEALQNAPAPDITETFAQQKDAWRRLYDFLRHNMVLHARDEEEGLFPMIDKRLNVRIDDLVEEHAWADAAGERLQQRFEELIAKLNPGEDALRTFADEWIRLARFHRNHINAENELLLPEARALLSAEQKRRLGNMMRSHRGLSTATEL